MSVIAIAIRISFEYPRGVAGEIRRSPAWVLVWFMFSITSLFLLARLAGCSSISPYLRAKPIGGCRRLGFVCDVRRGGLVALLILRLTRKADGVPHRDVRDRVSRNRTRRNARAHLTLVKEDLPQWRTLYRCPAIGRYWRESWPHSELHGDGFPELDQITAADALSELGVAYVA
jgi:hypothetical protein